MRIVSLAAICMFGTLSVAQTSPPTSAPSPQPWIYLTSEIDPPLVIDVESMELDYYSKAITAPMSRENALMWLGLNMRRGVAVNRGLIFTKFDPTQIYGAVQPNWMAYSLLNRLSEDQLTRSIATGMPFGELDDQSRSILLRNVMGTEQMTPQMYGRLPGRFSIGLRVEVKVDGVETPATVSLHEYPTSGRDSYSDWQVPQWMSLPKIATDPIEAEERQVDFGAGELLTLRQIGDKVAEKFPTYIRFDYRTTSARYFVKGNWALSDLAIALAKVSETIPTVLMDVSEQRVAARQSFDDVTARLLGQSIEGLILKDKIEKGNGRMSFVELREILPDIRGRVQFRDVGGDTQATMSLVLVLSVDFGKVRVSPNTVISSGSSVGYRRL